VPARTIGAALFASTLVAILVLYAVGILPLWLAAVILVADGAMTLLYVVALKRAGNG